MRQGDIKQHQYVVNYWIEPKPAGTACLWRGTKKSEWHKAIADALKEHPTRPKHCRVVEQQDRTVFSFTTPSALEMWLKSTVFPPATKIYGIPREVMAWEDTLTQTS